ncbi:MAG TPA: hypothetical protein DD624_08095 [Alphaproteobacteria bacterium]|nr:hypothetical protein [Alphaproteobacteria bacterium]
MEIMTSSMLQKVLDEPKQKVSYDPNEQLTVDVDLSLCTDEEMPRMIHIVNRLAKSEAGRETLEIANKAGVKFGFLDAKTNCFGCYFGGDMKYIGLGPMASDDKLVSTLCHESRHAGQAERMKGMPDRDQLNVASIVRYSRAKEADAQAYAVKACKELEMQGDKGPLATFAKFYPPIYKSYEQAFAKEGVLNDKVVSEVFKGWYDQTRTKQNYEEGYIIEPMHDAIKGNFTRMYTFAENVNSKTVVEKVGWTKNGNYLSAENPNFLDEPRFASVGERTKSDAQAFFEIRYRCAGIAPDKSVDALPTNKDAFERRLPEMGQPRGNVGETMSMGNTIERWRNILAQRKLTGTLKKAFAPYKKAEYPDEKPAVDVDLRYCAKKDRPRMIALINRLARSKVGLETLQIAADNGFHFNFIKGENRAFGFADPEHKRIALNPKFTDAKLVGTMCHECRHAGQFMRASNLEENRWDVKTNLIYMRAMEADAQAYAATACEEMFRLGDEAPKQEFYKYYPPIAKGFTQALIKNDAQLGDQLLTDTFKSWYDQQGTKTVYEANYLLEPMQQDLRDIANGKDKEHQMSFDMSISAQKTISEIAWTKHGNYFKDNPEILNGGKYLDVCDYTMQQMRKYFEIRKEMTGKDDAKALEGIPTRADTIPARTKGMKKPVAKKDKVALASFMKRHNQGR